MFDRRTFLRPIAHRGLHDNHRNIVENSQSAFLAAMTQDVGIECDVRASADGQPIVFHDATLSRLVDACGRVDNYSCDTLTHLRYRNSRDRILSLTDLFAIVGGRVPILVEVKTDTRAASPEFIAALAESFDAYEGPAALMSFDTQALAMLKIARSHLPCGLVFDHSDQPRGDFSNLSASVARNLLRGLDASFCAVRIEDLSDSGICRAARALDVPLFTWTVKTPTQHQLAERRADAAIFERQPTCLSTLVA